MSVLQPTFDDVWKLIQEISKEMRAMSQESDRKFEKTREELREMSRDTDQKIKQVTESICRLGNKLGEFVEEMVRPVAECLFQERGIDVHEVHQNVEVGY